VSLNYLAFSSPYFSNRSSQDHWRPAFPSHGLPFSEILQIEWQIVHPIHGGAIRYPIISQRFSADIVPSPEPRVRPTARLLLCHNLLNNVARNHAGTNGLQPGIPGVDFEADDATETAL